MFRQHKLSKIQYIGQLKELTAKATIADERARNPYLAMPSESPMKAFAIPNMILQRRAQTTTPAAPSRNR